MSALPVSLSPCLPVFEASGRIISEFDIGLDGSVAFVAGAPGNPCDLFLRRPDGQELQLTRINHKLLADRTVAPTEDGIENIAVVVPISRDWDNNLLVALEDQQG